MKVLKTLLVVMLGTLVLLFSCAAIKPSERPDNKPVVFYTQYDCWQSPFNPHKILTSWNVVAADKLKLNMVLVLVGNSKVDWEKVKLQNIDPSLAPIPKGEIASSVGFVFVNTSIDTVELVLYLYANKLGVFHIYKLNVETECYELLQDLTLQNAYWADGIKMSSKTNKIFYNIYK